MQTVNHTVKNISTASMRSSDVCLTPVSFSIPRASPASSPSISNRTIMPQVFKSSYPNDLTAESDSIDH
eukprot:1064495-Amphidinium_carterae.1